MPQDSRPTQNQLESIENEIKKDEDESDLYRQENGKLEDYDQTDDDVESASFGGFDGVSKYEVIGSVGVVFVCILHFMQ